MLGRSWHLLSQLNDRAVPIYSRQRPFTLKSCSENHPTTHKHSTPLLPPHWFGVRGSVISSVYHIIAISVDTVGLTGENTTATMESFYRQCLGGDWKSLSCQLLKTWRNFRSGKKMEDKGWLHKVQPFTVFREGLCNVQVLHRVHILSSIKLSWVVHPWFSETTFFSHVSHCCQDLWV